MTFEEKYGAPPFDPNDPRDARIEAFNTAGRNTEAKTAEDTQDIMGGMLAGLACAMSQQMDTSDMNHAVLRAGLLDLIPWAVDLMRSIDGLPPLPEA